MRAATFGAMDGLVSNTALIAGVAASADAHTVVLSGVAGLVAGAFSMALGEYTSVTTANEQIDSEVRVEKRAFRAHPQAEQAELVGDVGQHGPVPETAAKATDEMHRDESRAVNFHLVQELGVDPEREAVAVDGRGVVVRDVRDRRRRPADPVSVGLRVAVVRAGLRRRRSVDRRWGGRAVHARSRCGLGRLRQLRSGRSRSRPRILVGTCSSARTVESEVAQRDRSPTVTRGALRRSSLVELGLLGASMPTRCGRVSEQHAPRPAAPRPRPPRTAGAR